MRKPKAGVFKLHWLEERFQNPFRDGLVWTVGVIIK